MTDDYPLVLHKTTNPLKRLLAPDVALPLRACFRRGRELVDDTKVANNQLVNFQPSDPRVANSEPTDSQGTNGQSAKRESRPMPAPASAWPFARALPSPTSRRPKP